MAETQTVHVQSAWLSKINWTQAVAFLAMVGATFGIDLDAETQNHILQAIIAGQAVVTWALKTFFTTTVTPVVAAGLTDTGAAKK